MPQRANRPTRHKTGDLVIIIGSGLLAAILVTLIIMVTFLTIQNNKLIHSVDSITQANHTLILKSDTDQTDDLRLHAEVQQLCVLLKAPDCPTPSSRSGPSLQSSLP